MTDLSRETKAFLAAARKQETTCAEDRARIRAKLSRRMAAGLVIGTAVTAGSAAAKAAPAGAWLSTTAWVPGLAKVVGVAVIAGASGAVAVHWAETTQTPQPHSDPSHQVYKGSIPRSAPRVTEARTGAEQPAITIDQTPAATASSEPVVLPSSPARRPQLEGAVTLSASSALAVGKTQPAPVDSLSSQVAAIRRARQAIRNGNGQAALGILGKQFPPGAEGALLPEASLARIAAYCELGNWEKARKLADDFLASYPGSPLVSQVRGSCAYSGGR